MRVCHRENRERAHATEHGVRQPGEPVIGQVEVLKPRYGADNPKHFRREPIVAEQQRRELRTPPEEADGESLEAITAEVDDGGSLEIPGVMNRKKSILCRYFQQQQNNSFRALSAAWLNASHII